VRTLDILKLGPVGRPAMLRATLLLLLAGVSFLAWAQMPEVPREVPRDTSKETANESPGEEHAREPAPVLNGHISGRVETVRRSMEVARVNAAPAAHTVYWQTTRDGNGRPSSRAYEVVPDVPPPGRPLGLEGLKALVHSGPIVHSGEVPSVDNLEKLTGSRGADTVIHESSSANRDPAEIDHAEKLGRLPLNPGNTHIFNALPQETGVAASTQERTRMGLQRTGTPEAWRRVNDEIERTTEGFPRAVATREAILEELQHGSSDVIVLYAHFDGERLHLPGKDGTLKENSISVDEIARMQSRSGDPKVRDRVIVLVSCNGATQIKGHSLAEAILAKGIARTVFATDKPYDARQIGELMTQIKAQAPIREAGGQLHQYVELRRPAGLHDSRGVEEVCGG
jgi:hypothetical protein